MHGYQLRAVCLEKSKVPIEFRNILLELYMFRYHSFVKREVIQHLFELCVSESKKNLSLLDIGEITDFRGELQLKFREFKKLSEHNFWNKLLVALEIGDPEYKPLQIVSCKMHLKLSP